MTDSSASQTSGGFLEEIRLYELELALQFMPRGSRVLELGAGSGWQARALSGRGYEVTAIDLASSNYRAQRIWPVVDYDGEHIPFADASFDVVFSSNVLEHIPHIDAIQNEIQRVLQPGGLAIHILPSSTWRVWTSLAHYPYVLLFLTRFAGGRTSRVMTAGDLSMRVQRRGIWGMLGRVLLSPRHGELGNPISEIYYFSRFRWMRLFRRTGWIQLTRVSSHLFYTGYLILGSGLPLSKRTALSRVLGGSCSIFVLRKPEAQVQ